MVTDRWYGTVVVKRWVSDNDEELAKEAVSHSPVAGAVDDVAAVEEEDGSKWNCE